MPKAAIIMSYPDQDSNLPFHPIVWVFCWFLWVVRPREATDEPVHLEKHIWLTKFWPTSVVDFHENPEWGTTLRPKVQGRVGYRGTLGVPWNLPLGYLKMADNLWKSVCWMETYMEKSRINSDLIILMEAINHWKGRSNSFDIIIPGVSKGGLVTDIPYTFKAS